MQLLKSGKACGIDNISAEILKAGEQIDIEGLYELFYLIWEKEETPEEWCEALLLPFYKKADKMVCANHRGISLLVIASKVLEIVLLNRLREEKEIRTRENQAGFRPGRGCTGQIFTLRQIVEERYEYQRPTLMAFSGFLCCF